MAFTPRQKSFRWYADNNAEPVSGDVLANQDTSYTLTSGSQVLRLRLTLRNTGTTASTRYVGIRYSTDDTNYTAMGASNHWNYYNGLGSAGSAVTTNLLDDSGTGKGEYTENNTNTFAFAAATSYEFDICIQPTIYATPGTTYYFRAYQGSTGPNNIVALDTSEISAQVVTQAGASVPQKTETCTVTDVVSRILVPVLLISTFSLASVAEAKQTVPALRTQENVLTLDYVPKPLIHPAIDTYSSVVTEDWSKGRVRELGKSCAYLDEWVNVEVFPSGITYEVIEYDSATVTDSHEIQLNPLVVSQTEDVLVTHSLTNLSLGGYRFTTSDSTVTSEIAYVIPANLCIYNYDSVTNTDAITGSQFNRLLIALGEDILTEEGVSEIGLYPLKFLVTDDITTSTLENPVLPYYLTTLTDSATLLDVGQVWIPIYKTVHYEEVTVSESLKIALQPELVQVFDLITTEEALQLWQPTYKLSTSDNVVLEYASTVELDHYEIAVHDSVAYTDFAIQGTTILSVSQVEYVATSESSLPRLNPCFISETEDVTLSELRLYRVQPEIITNGSMEEDCSWSSINAPETNEQSNAQAKTHVYSRHIVDSTASLAGCYQNVPKTAGLRYGLRFWYYLSSGVLRYTVWNGNSSSIIISGSCSTTESWTEVVVGFDETVTGSNGGIFFQNNSGSVGAEFYIDDVSLLVIPSGIVKSDSVKTSEYWEAVTSGGVTAVYDSTTVTDAISIQLNPLLIGETEDVTTSESTNVILSYYLISTSDEVVTSESGKFAPNPLQIATGDSTYLTVSYALAGWVKGECCKVTDEVTVWIPNYEIVVYDSVVTSEDRTLGPFNVNVYELVTTSDAVIPHIPIYYVEVSDSVVTSESICTTPTVYFLHTSDLVVTSEYVYVLPMLSIDTTEDVTTSESVGSASESEYVSVYDLVTTEESTSAFNFPLSIAESEDVTLSEAVTRIKVLVAIKLSDSVVTSENISISLHPLKLSVFDLVTTEEWQYIQCQYYFFYVSISVHDDIIYWRGILYYEYNQADVTVTENVRCHVPHRISVSDLITTSESKSLREPLYKVSTSDSVVTSELVTPWVSYYPLSVTEDIVTSESIELNSQGINASVEDTVSTSELVKIAITPRELSVFDLVVTSDRCAIAGWVKGECCHTTDYTTVRISTYLISTYDSVVTSESVTRGPFDIELYEEVTVSESSDADVPFYKIKLSEYVTTSDSTYLQLNPLVISLGDSVLTSELSSELLHYFQIISDVVTTSEQSTVLSGGTIISVTDSVVTSELSSVITAQKLSVYDSVLTSDYVASLPTFLAISTYDSVAMQSPLLLSDTFEPAQSSDDCIYISSGPSINLTLNWTTFGAGGYMEASNDSGFRFTNVNIPRGATILSAYVTFQAYETNIYLQSAYSCNVRIRGQIGDASTFSTTTEYEGRTRTTAYVDWSPTDWTVDTDYNTPSLTSVVQEIVDSNYWSTGNDLGIFVDDSGSAYFGFRKPKSYDLTPNSCARLYVQWASVVSNVTVSVNPLPVSIAEDDIDGMFVTDHPRWVMNPLYISEGDDVVTSENVFQPTAVTLYITVTEDVVTSELTPTSTANKVTLYESVTVTELRTNKTEDENVVKADSVAVTEISTLLIRRNLISVSDNVYTTVKGFEGDVAIVVTARVINVSDSVHTSESNSQYSNVLHVIIPAIQVDSVVTSESVTVKLEVLFIAEYDSVITSESTVGDLGRVTELPTYDSTALSESVSVHVGRWYVVECEDSTWSAVSDEAETWTVVECEGRIWTDDIEPGSRQAGSTREVTSITSSAVVTDVVYVTRE